MNNSKKRNRRKMTQCLKGRTKSAMLKQMASYDDTVCQDYIFISMLSLDTIAHSHGVHFLAYGI